MLQRCYRVRFGGPFGYAPADTSDHRPKPDRPEHFVSCTPDTPEMRALVLEVVGPIPSSSVVPLAGLSAGPREGCRPPSRE